MENVYDRLVKYHTDPEKFKEEKNKILEEYFLSLDEQREIKARQMQWTIEGELRKQPNDVLKYNKIIEMTYKSLFELNDALKPFRKD